MMHAEGEETENVEIQVNMLAGEEECGSPEDAHQGEELVDLTRKVTAAEQTEFLRELDKASENEMIILPNVHLRISQFASAIITGM